MLKNNYLEIINQQIKGPKHMLPYGITYLKLRKKICTSPPNFIYPKRGKGKYRLNPREKRQMGKEVGYAMGRY